MVSTRTARILRIARPTPRTEATPPSSGGQHGPRRRARRTPAGRVALTIEVDLKRLQRPPHTGAAPRWMRHRRTRARRSPTPTITPRRSTSSGTYTAVPAVGRTGWRAKRGRVTRGSTHHRVHEGAGSATEQELHLRVQAWTWTSLFQAVRDTRSYETGLDAGLLLLRAAAALCSTLQAQDIVRWGRTSPLWGLCTNAASSCAVVSCGRCAGSSRLWSPMIDLYRKKPFSTRGQDCYRESRRVWTGVDGDNPSRPPVGVRCGPRGSFHAIASGSMMSVLGRKPRRAMRRI